MLQLPKPPRFILPIFGVKRKALVYLVFYDLTPNGFDIVVVLFSRVKRPVGDATGNRTPVTGETVRYNHRYTMAPNIKDSRG